MAIQFDEKYIFQFEIKLQILNVISTLIHTFIRFVIKTFNIYDGWGNK